MKRWSMEAFLLLILLQLVGAIFFMIRIYGFHGVNRYLLLILGGATVAILSKLILVRFFKSSDISASVSFSIGFSAIAYLFIKEILTQKKVAKNVILIHCIPYLFSVLWFIMEIVVSYFGWSSWNNVVKNRMILFSDLRYYILLFYLLLSVQTLILYKNRFFEIRKKANYALILFFIGDISLLFILMLYVYIARPITLNWLTILGLSHIPFLGWIITYYKILIPFRRQRLKLTLLMTRLKGAERPKYAKLDKQKKEVMDKKELIISYIDQNKPYLELEFSFEELCEGVGLSKHEVSFILNQCLGINFYQLINEKRVAYFLEHIDEVVSKKQTILALAYQSGFSSKSTFNKYFKQVTQKTPTEYLKLLVY
ncbi:helix-turn-helix domain-containing protein [Myroides odoratimimus]|uniref:helix-turn-helix domain-containing protein n=1 Tax=Myroides odoratimimus TaxID=76832 RepID=UPI0026DF7F8E|nr:helix-turn-helix domain-containing protein [Myroides odoratimimus]MDO5858306.1 helix-turn-helix domain-containing protein [Myroides odoratimimus]